MAYFKAQQMKTNKKYYPMAVLVDEPIEIDELVEDISEMSTVSKADTVAVLASLPRIMARGMNSGRSVHLQDLGFFRYTISSKKGGKDTPEEVTADDVARTRIRFTPETRYNVGRTAATRVLAPDSVRWRRWDGNAVSNAPSTGDGTTDGGSTGGGSEDGDNPIG